MGFGLLHRGSRYLVVPAHTNTSTLRHKYADVAILNPKILADIVRQVGFFNITE